MLKSQICPLFVPIWPNFGQNLTSLAQTKWLEIRLNMGLYLYWPLYLKTSTLDYIGPYTNVLTTLASPCCALFGFVLLYNSLASKYTIYFIRSLLAYHCTRSTREYLYHLVYSTVYHTIYQYTRCTGVFLYHHGLPHIYQVFIVLFPNKTFNNQAMWVQFSFED